MIDPHEKITVVDSDNRVIGYKERRELKDSDHIRTIAIWVENTKGQVLLQRRAEGLKYSPGLWTCAVEGTVPAGHEYDETAYKELEEEIGVTGITLKPGKQMHYKSTFCWRHVKGYTAVCNWQIEKFSREPDEVMQLAWWDKETAIKALQEGDTRFPRAGRIWLELFNLV